MRTSNRPSLLALALGVAACGGDLDLAGVPESAPTEAPTEAEEPVAEQAAAVAIAGELRGLVTTTAADPTANRCVPNPVGQLQALRDHGDILGFNMGAGYPNPAPYSYHWQGIQRLPIGGGRLFAVSSSNAPATGGHLAIVQLGSRGTAGGRLRSNRLSTTTQDWNVQPAGSDGIVQDLLVNTVFNHPGGLQTLGRYLLVPLERTGDSADLARVYLYDTLGTTDPWSCNPATGVGCLTKKWGFVVGATGAGTVSAARLADGRYVMVTTRKGISTLEVHVSQAGKALTDPTAFGTWGSFEGLWNSTSPWEEYQNLSMLVGCDGQLYLLGSHNNGSEPWSVFGGWDEDWLDLFELHLVPSGTRNADGDPSLTVGLTKVANRHLYCGTSAGKTQCNLMAGGGAWVDPQGRLYFYATEHDNDGPGGSVKMMEFRPGNHLDDPGTSGVEGCPSLSSAYVELFDGTSYGGTSLMIDYADRLRRNYANFGTAFDFHDRARSARFCIPSGTRYRLWKDSNRTGASVDLVGTGARQSVSWSTNLQLSSGCYHNGTSCL